MTAGYCKTSGDLTLLTNQATFNIKSLNINKKGPRICAGLKLLVCNDDLLSHSRISDRSQEVNALRKFAQIGIRWFKSLNAYFTNLLPKLVNYLQPKVRISENLQFTFCGIGINCKH